jgi:anaerobic selenocysteine-containing dehydrogenase
VAVIGGAAAGYANSLAAAEAVAALNELSGSYGVEGGVRFDPPEEGAVGSLESVARATVILVAGCNPDYEFPGLLPSGAWVASFASFPDETAERAQLVLPDHTALEAWQDSIPEALGYLARSVARPAVLPMYETRDAADVLLEVLGKLGKKQPAENWPKMIETSFASEEDFSTAIEQGGLWAEAPGKFTFATASKKFEFGKEPWSPPQFGPGGDLWLQPYAGVALGKGQASNVPWLQELPDPLSQTVWGTAVELNPKTAAKLGVAEGDRVTVQSARGQLTGRAVISPGCPPNVVAVAAGQGHRSFGRYAAGRGGNVYALVDATQWASAKVSVRKIWFLESRW